VGSSSGVLKRGVIHLFLFILTFVTTVFAGVQWLNLNPYELANIERGIPYAIAVCTILLAHELGHYIAARYHSIDATFPFFLPFPSFLLGGLFPFGTLGALIRIKSPIVSRRALFDVGASGPIAGVVASLAFLFYGFSSLPTVDYLYAIHPEYARMASLPKGGLTFGAPLAYSSFGKILAGSGAFIPPMNEIYHYPFLCAGWFGLFVTAMNLIPIGQLDGGHISAAVFGDRSRKIGIVFLILLSVLGILGFAPLLGLESGFGWPGWLLWALVLALFLRRSGLEASGISSSTHLGFGRKAVALVCLLVFLLSFSIAPFAIDF
jgi:membrane-associated protease RseP (regulator of RpoE activity)